jgi:hypothetical protein
MHKVRGYYSSWRSSENICSSSGGAEGKRGTKPDETQFGTKNGAFHPPWKANVLFYRLKKISSRFWTKLRVLVPCFPDFTENSHILIFRQGYYGMQHSFSLSFLGSLVSPARSTLSQSVGHIM